MKELILQHFDYSYELTPGVTVPETYTDMLEIYSTGTIKYINECWGMYNKKISNKILSIIPRFATTTDMEIEVTHNEAYALCEIFDCEEKFIEITSKER